MLGLSPAAWARIAEAEAPISAGWGMDREAFGEFITSTGKASKSWGG